MEEKCYACDRKLGRTPALVEAIDQQTMYVGSECFKRIQEAGRSGYQPPKGGPRLYLLGHGYTATPENRHVSNKLVEA